MFRFRSSEPFRRMRRRFIRVKTDNLPCSFNILFIAQRPVDLSPGTGQLVDLSRDGLGFRSPLRLPVHVPTLLLVRFSLDGKNFFQTGRLIWRRITGDTYRYGLQFWGSSPEQISQLQQHLDNLKLDVEV